MFMKVGSCFVQKLALGSKCMISILKIEDIIRQLNFRKEYFQGIHGEALLCKSFYLIRETFVCGEQAVKTSCNEQAFIDLGKLKSQVNLVFSYFYFMVEELNFVRIITNIYQFNR